MWMYFHQWYLSLYFTQCIAPPTRRRTQVNFPSPPRCGWPLLPARRESAVMDRDNILRDVRGQWRLPGLFLHVMRKEKGGKSRYACCTGLCSFSFLFVCLPLPIYLLHSGSHTYFPMYLSCLVAVFTVGYSYIILFRIHEFVDLKCRSCAHFWRRRITFYIQCYLMKSWSKAYVQYWNTSDNQSTLFKPCSMSENRFHVAKKHIALQ